MSAPTAPQVLTLADLHLETGKCDTCNRDDTYIVFVVINPERAMGFYQCHDCRKHLIEGLVSV